MRPALPESPGPGLRNPHLGSFPLTGSLLAVYSQRSMSNQTLCWNQAERSGASSLVVSIGLLIVVLTGGGPV